MNLTVLVCNIRFYFVCFLSCYGEASFLLALMAPEYWEAFKQSEALALNETAVVKTPLLGLGNDL